ncbi:unnamed protein product [Cuscuta epithymum]|uniref:Uncharacterized protein n=2 Tax=Cuscuta epithymum TaxID=186058 RepID=A0AAV0D7U5_9ASTE|nr:unnamed protein product [Cuscuta epithymum]
MEELQKLQKLHSMIETMQSFGIIGSPEKHDSNSLRFLANFALLLVEEGCELDIDTKCLLILQHLPRFSPEFFEEASKCISGEGSLPKPMAQDIQNSASICSNDEKVGPDQKQWDFRDVALISMDGILHANSTLEDFCRSYFMFHGIDAHQPQSIFKYLPILSFTESFIYQLDKLNEKFLRPSWRQNTILCNKPCGGGDQSLPLKPVSITSDAFGPLVNILDLQGLLTDRISEEFRNGIKYWSLERKLCNALASKLQVSVTDVMRAIQLKSFDYRVLSLLLYQLRGEKVNELHMEFLSISEFLVEISDDLFDYEDDVLQNSFNILRMFVQIYGATAAPPILAKHITEAEAKYSSLLEALGPELSVGYQKRCEEATKEGGKKGGPPLGTWCIPHVIEDEDLYRSTVSSPKP